MNNIEAIICLILLFMAVPDWCRKLQRPALAYAIFILFGILLDPVVDPKLQIMLEQAGQVGFLLLLFTVGLEIDLPPLRQFLGALRYAVGWSLWQYPVVISLGMLVGMTTLQAVLTAAAITGCSVGMAYPAWKSFPGENPQKKQAGLNLLVALEVLTIILLAVNAKVLDQGLSWWILARLIGIAAVIFLLARFALHLVPILKLIIEKTTHWRMHWLVLLIFGICAIGQRLGLDSTKTAFFLGLALSRARHHGMQLEEVIAPISQRFLIPIFFVSLGLQMNWKMFFSQAALLALGGAGLLIGLRQIMHQRWFASGMGAQAFLLFCPNLTMVALAANGLLMRPETAPFVPWLLMTGLFMTVMAIFALPKEVAAVESESKEP